MNVSHLERYILSLLSPGQQSEAERQCLANIEECERGIKFFEEMGDLYKEYETVERVTKTVETKTGESKFDAFERQLARLEKQFGQSLVI